LGFLHSAGPVAAGERHLLIIVGLVMLVVIAPVIVLTPVFAWHYRLANTRNAFRPTWSFSWVLEFFIWIPPTLIVVGLAALLWRSSSQFDPYTRLASPLPPLEVQAIGFDWKWVFIYPDSDIVTVNQLVLPAGRAVHISLTSATVMQSMLIPQLAGQIYAMPGMTTQLNLQADKPGVFAGRNTQYNGEGFPEDDFSVISLTPTDFGSWLARIRSIDRPLTDKIFAELSSKSTEPRALAFSAAPTGLFQQTLARTRSSP
jgi:cytochrome o ubiquinol oxidase subunit 2